MGKDERREDGVEVSKIFRDVTIRCPVGRLTFDFGKRSAMPPFAGKLQHDLISAPFPTGAG